MLGVGKGGQSFKNKIAFCFKALTPFLGFIALLLASLLKFA
jgi:hypothetical protein